jgi:hypothetical protein
MIQKELYKWLVIIKINLNKAKFKTKFLLLNNSKTWFKKYNLLNKIQQQDLFFKDSLVKGLCVKYSSHMIKILKIKNIMHAVSLKWKIKEH